MAPGLTDFLRRLTGGGGEAASAESREADRVDYKSYRIQPAPRKEGSQWVVAGTITKAEPDGTRTYRFIRADSHASREGAVELTVIKAKQMIDLEGDRLFDRQG